MSEIDVAQFILIGILAILHILHLATHLVNWHRR